MASGDLTLPLDSAVAADVTIYDVGHGNAALIRTDDWAVLVDVPPAAAVFEDLKNRGVTRIDHLVLSHAERDHFGGAMRLLDDPDIDVGAVHVNPDATKAGKMWKRFRSTAYRAAQERGVEVGHLVTDLTPALESGEARVEFLHPDYEWAMGGVGSESTNADANTLSIVARVWLRDVAVVLLAADLTSSGIDRLQDLGVDLHAELLVFPHHGGLPGDGDPELFASRVADLVRPTHVLFSFGRGIHSNPRPSIVDGLRSVVPDLDVRCTQLSRHCAPDDQARPITHLSERPAAGRSTGESCLGTLTVMLVDGRVTFDPPLAAHNEFVIQNAEVPMCRSPSPLREQA